MSDIEIKPEGAIVTPIDAFPRPTSQEDTPPAPPVAVEKLRNQLLYHQLQKLQWLNLRHQEAPAPAPEVPLAPTPVQPETPTTPVPKPEPDYKKKFADSTRRNQIVESQFKELQKVLGDITKQEVPTDEEMQAIVPDWEYLTDREKNGERKLVVLERRQNHMLNTFSSITAESEMYSQLETFVAGEPRLNGKETEFYEFATDPRNKGASMEVPSMRFSLRIRQPSKKPQSSLRWKRKPHQLLRATPSGNMPPIKTGNEEMSADELKLLRTTDPRKYNEMIRKGQIK